MLRAPHGFSLIELLLATGTLVVLTVIAVPVALAGLDDARASGAARYLSARMARARMESIARSVDVGLRFTVSAAGYEYAIYVDGDGDGVRTADITAGVDRPLMPPEHLADQFPGVDFAVMPGLPPVETGGTPPGSDPIHLGASDIVTFTPSGTATAGSLYIRGRGPSQYVVRVFGTTARTRLLKFDGRTGRWSPI